MLPFKENKVDEKVYIREFNDLTDITEFKWHRDNEDRLIECSHETDWMFQKENELPISFNRPIFIKRHEWHRVIRGKGILVLKITKYI